MVVKKNKKLISAISKHEKMETNHTDGHKQKMPTPYFHKFRNHGPQQIRLTICKTEFKRISTFVHLVLLTVVEIRSDPYTSVAQL